MARVMPGRWRERKAWAVDSGSSESILPRPSAAFCSPPLSLDEGDMCLRADVHAAPYAGDLSPWTGSRVAGAQCRVPRGRVRRGHIPSVTLQERLRRLPLAGPVSSAGAETAYTGSRDAQGPRRDPSPQPVGNCRTFSDPRQSPRGKTWGLGCATLAWRGDDFLRGHQVRMTLAGGMSGARGYQDSTPRINPLAHGVAGQRR